jgi:Spy/CpxP family protein refolding chaperone
MKNNHCAYVLMMAAASLFLLSAPSMAMEKECASGPGGSMGGERGMKHERGFWKDEDKALGLTDEQRSKMKVIRAESKVRQDALRKEVKARHDALRQELDAEKPDRAKAAAIVKEMGVLEERKGLDRVEMILKIRDILTPEQYKKLQAFHEKKRSGSKEHRGKKKAE